MGAKGLVYCVKPGRSILVAIPVPKTRHREMLAELEKGVSAGGNPVKVWAGVLRDHWRDLTASERRRFRLALEGLRLAVFYEIERCRYALGWSEELISEKAGLADRAFAKWLRPWEGSAARVPTDETITALVKAVRVAGFRMQTVPLSVEEYDAKLRDLAVRHGSISPLVGQRMRELSALGVMGQRRIPSSRRREAGRMGGKAAAAAMSPKQRRERASAGGRAKRAKVRQVDSLCEIPPSAVAKHTDA